MRKDGRTDGQTDMMKLIVAFRNWAKAPTKLFFSQQTILLYSQYLLAILYPFPPIDACLQNISHPNKLCTNVSLTVSGNQEKMCEKSIASHFKSNILAFTKAQWIKPRNTLGWQGNGELGKTKQKQSPSTTTSKTTHTGRWVSHQGQSIEVFGKWTLWL
jgi:hypothetical protein